MSDKISLEALEEEASRRRQEFFRAANASAALATQQAKDQAYQAGQTYDRALGLLARAIEREPAYLDEDRPGRLKRLQEERRLLRTLIGLPENHAF